jgi:tetratricopeptide (TPR) repeat protein
MKIFYFFKYFTSVFIVMSLSSGVNGFQGDSSTKKPKSSSPEQAEISLHMKRGWRPTDYLWLEVGWSDKRSPYQEVSVEMQRKLSDKTSREKLLSYYEKNVSEKSSPLDRFKYAFVIAYMSGVGKWSGRESIEKRKNAVFLLAVEPWPPTYDYIRLRFFIESRVFPDTRLIPLGKRLIEFKPDDVVIKERYIVLLSISKDIQDRERAVRIADSLLATNPKRAKNYAILGASLWGVWGLTRKEKDGDKAIAAYEKYLSLTPMSDPWRNEAKQIVDSIRASIKASKNP